MKNLFLILSLALIFSGCSKSDEEIQEEQLTPMTGTFNHQIENCIEVPGFEINCWEFIRFEDNNKVGMLLGGSDIVIWGDYTRKGNEIQVSITEGGNMKYSFRIDNEKQLTKTDDQTVWVKEE